MSSHHHLYQLYASSIGEIRYRIDQPERMYNEKDYVGRRDSFNLFIAYAEETRHWRFWVFFSVES